MPLHCRAPEEGATTAGGAWSAVISTALCGRRFMGRGYTGAEHLLRIVDHYQGERQRGTWGDWCLECRAAAEAAHPGEG